MRPSRAARPDPASCAFALPRSRRWRAARQETGGSIHRLPGLGAGAWVQSCADEPRDHVPDPPLKLSVFDGPGPIALGRPDVDHRIELDHLSRGPVGIEIDAPEIGLPRPLLDVELSADGDHAALHVDDRLDHVTELALSDVPQPRQGERITDDLDGHTR